MCIKHMYNKLTTAIWTSVLVRETEKCFKKKAQFKLQCATFLNVVESLFLVTGTARAVELQESAEGSFATEQVKGLVQGL